MSRARGHEERARQFDDRFIRVATAPGAEALYAQPLAMFYARSPRALDAALAASDQARRCGRGRSADAGRVEAAGARDHARPWYGAAPRSHRSRIFPGMTARTLYRLNAVLLLGFVLVSLAAWEHVPERVPLHFGLAGDPDHWARKSVVSWLGLPAIAVAVAAFIYAVHRAGRPYPETWNVPEKEQFRRLAREDQKVVWEMIDTAVAGTMLLTTVILVAAQAAAYLVATGRAAGIPWYVAAIEVTAIAGVLVMALALKRQARRYIRSHTRP